MTYADALREWAERFGSETGFDEWLRPHEVRSGVSQSLTEAGRVVVAKFVARLTADALKIANEHPDFMEWYRTQRDVLVDAVMPRISLRTGHELVDVMGLVRYLASLIETTADADDLRMWTVEAIAMLRDALQHGARWSG